MNQEQKMQDILEGATEEFYQLLTRVVYRLQLSDNALALLNEPDPGVTCWVSDVNPKSIENVRVSAGGGQFYLVDKVDGASVSWKFFRPIPKGAIK
jgi:hypothetical protein